MRDCRAIDELVTPYVDGGLATAARVDVDQHIGRCSICRDRVRAEQAVRQLLVERQRALKTPCASAALRAACARSITSTPAPVRLGDDAPRVPLARLWRVRVAPLATAATLLLLLGGAFVYQATERSSRVMAAELAADHVKCFTMNAVLGTHHSPQVVESEMADSFGWSMRVPGGAADQDLELVGSRPCLYGQGKIAHIMYRHHGQPVSLFMLPRRAQLAQTIDVLGQECAIWSRDDRTFVLVAHEARADVEKLAGFMHDALE